MENNRRKIKSLADDEEFPGYPKYEPAEDIMTKGKRVDANLDDEIAAIDKSVTTEPISPLYEEVTEGVANGLKADKESKVTAEDLEALGPKDLSLDMNDDEQLKHRTTPVDFSGKDLDIPGSELDDESESIGSEDEENNSYSIGGDNHNDLEESHE